MRERAKFGHPVPTFGEFKPCAMRPRGFVLATGERTEAVSGCELPFSLYELPDHFEFSWPMHELLPIELAPLNAPFLVITCVGVALNSPSWRVQGHVQGNEKMVVAHAAAPCDEVL